MNINTNQSQQLENNQIKGSTCVRTGTHKPTIGTTILLSSKEHKPITQTCSQPKMEYIESISQH